MALQAQGGWARVGGGAGAARPDARGARMQMLYKANPPDRNPFAAFDKGFKQGKYRKARTDANVFKDFDNGFKQPPYRSLDEQAPEENPFAKTPTNYPFDETEGGHEWKHWEGDSPMDALSEFNALDTGVFARRALRHAFAAATDDPVWVAAGRVQRPAPSCVQRLWRAQPRFAAPAADAPRAAPVCAGAPDAAFKLGEHTLGRPFHEYKPEKNVFQDLSNDGTARARVLLWPVPVLGACRRNRTQRAQACRRPNPHCPARASRGSRAPPARAAWCVPAGVAALRARSDRSRGLAGRRDVPVGREWQVGAGQERVLRALPGLWLPGRTINAAVPPLVSAALRCCQPALRASDLGTCRAPGAQSRAARASLSVGVLCADADPEQRGGRHCGRVLLGLGGGEPSPPSVSACHWPRGPGTQRLGLVTRLSLDSGSESDSEPEPPRAQAPSPTSESGSRAAGLPAPARPGPAPLRKF